MNEWMKLRYKCTHKFMKSNLNDKDFQFHLFQTTAEIIYLFVTLSFSGKTYRIHCQLSTTVSCTKQTKNIILPVDDNHSTSLWNPFKKMFDVKICHFKISIYPLLHCSLSRKQQQLLVWYLLFRMQFLTLRTH